MRIPVSYQRIYCPNCGYPSNITQKESFGYWLADTVWMCPICKTPVTTKELHEHEYATAPKEPPHAAR